MVNPLFNKNYVDKEMNSVHSEFISDDSDD